MDQLKRFALSSPALCCCTPRPRRSLAQHRPFNIDRCRRRALRHNAPSPNYLLPGASADGLASVFAVAGDRPGRLEIASRITCTACADDAPAAAPDRRRTARSRKPQQQQRQRRRRWRNRRRWRRRHWRRRPAIVRCDSQIATWTRAALAVWPSSGADRRNHCCRSRSRRRYVSRRGGRV